MEERIREATFDLDYRNIKSKKNRKVRSLSSSKYRIKEKNYRTHFSYNKKHTTIMRKYPVDEE
jgi:hypothetical protein